MLDFQELRAKFQDKKFLLGPPKKKPAVPEKPKVISPPLSPTHHLPSGARPSLLTSINQALESKTVNSPRVVFKGEKKDNKLLLIQNNSKVKEKSDGRPKESKEKTKESKEKLNENSSDHKEKNGKKLPIFGTQKENTDELVPASPPPKAKTQRKKNILGFKKSSKKDTEATSAESILDSTTGDIAGPALLIPVVCDANNTPQESIYSVPKQVLPKITIPESSAAVDVTTLSPIPEPPDFSPPPATIPRFVFHLSFQNPTPQMSQSLMIWRMPTPPSSQCQSVGMRTSQVPMFQMNRTSQRLSAMGSLIQKLRSTLRQRMEMTKIILHRNNPSKLFKTTQHQRRSKIMTFSCKLIKLKCLTVSHKMVLMPLGQQFVLHSPQTLYQSKMNDSNENLYEAVRLSSGKKKEKGNSGKKRKRTLKSKFNPPLLTHSSHTTHRVLIDS
ncbi:hypothetical protein XENOCAPTIV_022104 [Xenoophorus captivus]|uniref:Uncharacterized protein n=1 Tax=Xenoophorus captivus TaxID=1517983 RepID=A0ABV0QNT7_9TELE